MKSSDINLKENKNKSGFLSNSPMYSILAVYMPLSALLALIFLLEALFPINLPEIILITGGLTGALAASLYVDFMKDVKSSRTSANIRGGIIIMMIVYFSVSFIDMEKMLPERFMPNLTNVFAPFFALYAWINVISLKMLFNARRKFETITEAYHGEKLKQKLFEDSGLLQYTDENINKAWLNYFFQIGILCVITIVCAVFNSKMPLKLYVLLLVILTGAVCIHGLFKIIKWEQYYASEGLNLSANNRTKRILTIIFMTLLGLAFAYSLTSGNNLIPFSLVIGFFAWLFSLFARALIKTEGKAEVEEIRTNETAPFFSDMEELSISPIWEIILKYMFITLRAGFVILLGFLFIKFMISPLLNRGDESEKMPFFKRLILIIKESFKSMSNAFSAFLSHLKKDKTMKLRKYNDDDINRAAENLLNAYTSAKKSDMRQSVTLFARLIIWGKETRNITWKASHAPAEYCGILALASPVTETPEGETADSVNDSNADNEAELQKNEYIVRCGEIFEKALYSAEILSDAEKNEFETLVKEITS